MEYSITLKTFISFFNIQIYIDILPWEAGNMSSAYDFFMSHDVSAYSDQWVAIADDKILAHGKKVKAVLGEAEKKSKGRKFLLTRVPGKETMIL
jgi:hypothetical protein